LVRKFKEKRSFERCRNREKDNIKMNVKVIGRRLRIR
jgi:hypothetical protein